MFSETSLCWNGKYSRSDTDKNTHHMPVINFDDGRPLGRNGEYSVFWSKLSPGTGTEYFFRAVSDDEWLELRERGHFSRKNSYQGISPTCDYAEKYFGENQSHYLVEFRVLHAIDLRHEFAYAGTAEKVEAGVLSLGLGYRATPVQAGRPPGGGDYFMDGLKAGTIKWRLVAFIGKDHNTPLSKKFKPRGVAVD